MKALIRRMFVLGLVAVPVMLVAAPRSARAGEPDKKAVRLWKAKCASCHGVDGKGATEQGKKMKIGDMTSAEWQKEFTDEKIKNTILLGVDREKNGVKQVMTAQKGDMTDEQIALVTSYIRSLAPAK